MDREVNQGSRPRRLGEVFLTRRDLIKITAGITVTATLGFPSTAKEQPATNLAPEERQILRALGRRGVMTPLEISTDTLILPSEVFNLLRSLVARGYIIRKGVPVAPEGQAVILTDRGIRALRSNM